MLTRDEWFAQYGVEPGNRDPKTPLTMVAVLTAEILLDCYARAEIERLQRLAERDAVTDAWNEKLKRDNYSMLVRAHYLLGTEPSAPTR